MRITRSRNVKKIQYRVDRMTIVHKKKKLSLEVESENGVVVNMIGATKRDRTRLLKLTTDDETLEQLENLLNKRISVQS
jgi:hypothetical protein